jgi:hypothetical protein
MTVYFKATFKPYDDLCRSKRNKQPIMELIVKYLNDEQPGLLETLPSQAERDHFCELLKMLLFCHRHQKKDQCLLKPPIDFAIVREPMYKYSRVA